MLALNIPVNSLNLVVTSGVPRGEGVGVFKPHFPAEIPKALQNGAKLNPICENC